MKEKKSKYLVEPTPELLAALGNRITTNGTHTVKLGTNRVSAVVFCGKVQQVAEKSKLEKSGVLHKVVIPMICSPVIGFVGGLLLMTLLYGVLRSWRPVSVNRTFGKLQLVSAGYMGFSHGMNDATKTMGIITLALVAATKSGDLSAVPSFFGFLTTPEGSDPLHLSLGDKLISVLPTWLHFGYMPAIGDAKSQGVPYWVVFTCAITHGRGHSGGRLEDHQDNGAQDGEAPTCSWLRGRNHRGDRPRGHRFNGHAGLDHSRHHHQHHGRRLRQAFQRPEAESHREDYLGLDSDHSRYSRSGLRPRLDLQQGRLAKVLS